MKSFERLRLELLDYEISLQPYLKTFIDDGLLAVLMHRLYVK